MEESRFILVRHGQSVGNLHNTFLGHTDLPLTELGLRQARCTAEYLLNEAIDVMYASDLLRAYQTGQALADLKGMELIPNPRLREIDAGKWEGMFFDDIGKVYPREFDTWLCDLGHAVCPEGESVAELSARIVGEVTVLAERHPGRTVFIATHATPIRMLKVHTLGLRPEQANEVPWAPNASVTVFGVADGHFRLISDSYAEHLGDLITQFPNSI